MKNFTKNIRTSLGLVLTLIVALLYTGSLQAQVRKTFAPRQSVEAPAPYTNVKNYNLQGDFVMLGNTNMTLREYGVNKDNSNNFMVYVDEDNDNNTVNSSSAELVLPGGECTEIIYAGLYWSGRAHTGSSPEEFTINRGNGRNPISHTLNKRKVKLKKDNGSYIEVEANSSDIYYPSNVDGNMYSAYADVTEYVRAHGSGNYFVADLAVIEGNGGSTGFYGGWGMVVIYKNTSMKWRDITVFDGHAYVAGSVVDDYDLPISGFKATQYGDVNVTLGMMAGEGDRTIKGDFFRIKRRNGNIFDNLSHTGNTTDNFFNSSIEVGGTSRNPNLINNTGFDIAKFDINNTNNRYIGNNDTSTIFQYGTTQDTYIIYNMVFAVDAYVPEIMGKNTPTVYDGQQPAHNGTIVPGQELEFELEVFNKGTEPVNNTKVEIPIPFNLHYSDAEIVSGLPVQGGTITWVPPLGGTNDPTVTSGGTIIWDIGHLPLDDDKDKLLAKLKYRFKVSEDCIMLATNVCGLVIRINGKISGTGAVSGIAINSDLVQDYGNNVCAGPVYDDFISTITLSSDFLQNCHPPVEDKIMQFTAFCSVPGTGYDRSEIVNVYPEGTKFFDREPASYTSTQGLISGDFPVNSDGSKTLYYIMTPGMENGCYAKLEISVETIITSPTVEDVAICFGETLELDVELSETGITHFYELMYFDADQNQLADAPNPTEVGLYTYFVAEGVDGCFGPKIEFTITIHELPEVEKDVNDIEVCENFDSGRLTITTNGNDLVWEYLEVGSSEWQVLNGNTFPSVVINNENWLEIIHAETNLNGIKIRLNVSNGNCSDVSNEFELIVNDCPAATNPMLLNPAGK